MVAEQLCIECALRLDPFDDLVVEQVIQRGESGCTAYRMSAEGGYVPQHGILLQGLHDLGPRRERTQRHAAPECLGQTHDVGCNAVFEHGEQRSRAPHAGLYLIEYEQRPDFVATAPQRLQIARDRRADARFALHGFCKDACRAARDAL